MALLFFFPISWMLLLLPCYAAQHHTHHDPGRAASRREQIPLQALEARRAPSLPSAWDGREQNGGSWRGEKPKASRRGAQSLLESDEHIDAEHEGVGATRRSLQESDSLLEYKEEEDIGTSDEGVDERRRRRRLLAPHEEEDVSRKTHAVHVTSDGGVGVTSDGGVGVTSDGGVGVTSDEGVGVTRRSLLGNAALSSLVRRRRPVEGCWSRIEQRFFYEDDPFKVPSEAYKQRFKEYKEMHQRCTAHISNWNEFLFDASTGVKDGADVANCKYLIFQSPIWHGVGNRLMGLVSAFALALLTDRAILIEDSEFLGRALCNPFTQSTWRLPSENFRFIVDKVKKWVKDPEKNTTAFDLHISWDWTPWSEFCEPRQQSLEANRFGLMYSDFYLVPLYYLTKRFQEPLEKLFPDRRVFMHLGRSILFPENHIWDRITRTFQGYLLHNNYKIGIQIRETKDTGTGLIVNVLDCLVNKSNYLPDAMPLDDWRAVSLETEDEALRAFPQRKTGIFVTSLNGQHASLLHDRYTRGKPLDGSAVSVHTLSHYQKEMVEDYSHYEAATVEMWLLSFCDSLLISDYSTFGYVASGLSGMDPFMLNVAIRGSDDVSDWRRNGRPTCVPAFSEPCLVADVYQKCPGDSEAHAAWDNENLQKCPGVNRFLMAAPPKH